jgi:two-component system LytT family sensor kinase
MVEQQLVILLVKLAVAASLASILVRSGAFKRMLMREQRTLIQRLKLAFGFALIFGAAVGTRVVTVGRYTAVDLGFEGSLLAGILGGYVSGLTAGVLISIPAMINGEWASMALFAGVGVLGGLLRDLAPSTDDIWTFSPWVELNVWRIFRNPANRSRTLYHWLFLGTILCAEMLRWAAAFVFGDRFIFTIHRGIEANPVLLAISVMATTLFAVAIPLKIWNSTRIETKLVAQQRLLTEARLEALRSQINPHFLFNTLNSVASLIRTNPDQARTMVYKLSNILRGLLRRHENLNPLREEISFIGDYLAIELVRFGSKLRFVNEVAPETLGWLVPSMLLQPLVENCIKHGLGSKVEGGTIRIQSSISDGKLRLTVEDDGVGIPEAKMATLFEQGIGVGNVNQRLKLFFGNDYRFLIDSKPGEGTRMQIDIPELKPTPGAPSDVL